MDFGSQFCRRLLHHGREGIQHQTSHYGRQIHFQECLTNNVIKLTVKISYHIYLPSHVPPNRTLGNYLIQYYLLINTY